MDISEELDPIYYFHENSKLKKIEAYQPIIEVKRISFKEYNECQRIELPKTDLDIGLTLNKAILERKSCRRFVRKPVSLNTLSKILYFGYGVIGTSYFEDFEFLSRPIPSAGALYPHEIYLFTFNIEGIQSGVYHYSPFDHSIELLKTGDFTDELITLFMNQHYLINSSACIVLSGVLDRIIWKYGARSYRYILFEAGHVVQNMCLVSTTEGLGTLPLGGFCDDGMAKLIGVDPISEPALYGLVIGHK
jgi:SagB-type dehydrogenase family enzyme